MDILSFELHTFPTIYKDHDTGEMHRGPDVMALSGDMAADIVEALIDEMVMHPGSVALREPED